MASRSAVGYFDAEGVYRATYVGSDTDEPYIILRTLADIADGKQSKIEAWIEAGIAGGGYASLEGNVLYADTDEGIRMPLPTSDNYDRQKYNFVFLIEDAKPKFYDPKHVLDLDPRWIR